MTVEDAESLDKVPGTGCLERGAPGGGVGFHHNAVPHITHASNLELRSPVPFLLYSKPFPLYHTLQFPYGAAFVP